MGYDKHVESAVLPVYGGADGLGWVGTSGGSGTVALSGGGVPVAKNASGSGYTDAPLPLPVYTRPSASDSSYIEIGVPVPDGGVIGLRAAWVIYFEED